MKTSCYIASVLTVALTLGALPNVPYACALARAFNRWLAGRWLHEENGLYGLIVVPPQDPEEGAREIERWASNERMAGVFLPVCMNYPLWGNHKYDPIYKAAQHYDLPVLLHGVTGSSSGFPYNIDGFNTAISTHVICHTFAMMANLLSIMETGVPVRYPDLRICFCESGLSWVPFLRMKLDKEFHECRHLWPMYDDLPSKWLGKFYYATQPVEEPARAADLIDIIRIYDGNDITIFASDWPHHDFDHPNEIINLPASDILKRKFLGANALKLMPRVKVPAKYQGVYRQGETL